MTYREFVCDLAARDDSAFAEYVSGLRFPAHLREAYAFASANPRAIMLMPRGHGKTIGAIHHLARRIEFGAVQAVRHRAGDPEQHRRCRRRFRTPPGGSSSA